MFKATLAFCTALKPKGESMRTASLKADKGFVDVEGRGCGFSDSDLATRRRTFVGRNG